MPRKSKSTRARSMSALARALNVSLSSVRRWVSRGCPRDSDGSFDVEAVRRWAEEMRSEGRRKAAENVRRDAHLDGASHDLSGGVTSEASHERADADAQFKRLRAAKLAFDLQVARGQYVPRNEVEEMLVSRMQTFKRALRAVARRLAPEIVNIPDVREVQTRIQEAHDELLWDAYGGRDEQTG